MTRKQLCLLYGLLAVFGFGAFFFAASWQEPVSAPDTAQYLHRAREFYDLAPLKEKNDLSRGLLFSRRLPPLLPLLLSPFASNQIELERTAVLLMITLSTFALIFLTAILHRHHSLKTALVAYSLLLFHGFNLTIGSTILTEPLFAALLLPFLATLAYALNGQDNGPFILVGVLAALVFLTRDIGLTNIGFALLVTLVHSLIKKEFARRHRGLIFLALAFLVVTAPQFLHLHHRLGLWKVTAREVKKELAAKQSRLEQAKALQGKQRPPYVTLTEGELVKAAQRFGRNLVNYIVATVKLWGWPLAIGVFLALWSLFRFELPKRPLSLSMTITFLWLFHYLTILAALTGSLYDSRYLHPLLGPAVFLAALGYSAFIERYFKGSKVAHALLIVAIFLCQAQGFSFAYERNSEHLLARSWSAGHRSFARELQLEGVVNEGASFLARKPFLPYHLRGFLPEKWASGLPADKSELVKTLEKGEVDFIVADSDVLRNLQPEVINLALGIDLPRGIGVVMSRYIGSSNKVITLLSLEKRLAKGNKSPIALYEESDFVRAWQRAEVQLRVKPNTIEGHLLSWHALLILARCGRTERWPLFKTMPELLVKISHHQRRAKSLGTKDKRVGELEKKTSELFDSELNVARKHFGESKLKELSLLLHR